MDCAVDQNADELETWFINLWNHFVIPYLMGAVMAGIEVSSGLGACLPASHTHSHTHSLTHTHTHTQYMHVHGVVC